MAITAATKTTDFANFAEFNASQTGYIFEQARDISVVQRLARQVPMGFAGVQVPVSTGKPTASWVSEAAIKPASQGSQTIKTMTPQKLVVLTVVSDEVRRANPAQFLSMIEADMAEAIAQGFDAAVLHGTSTPFSAYLDETTKSTEIGAHTAAEGGVHADLVAAMRLLVEDGKKLNGWALDSVVEPALLESVDANGRPIYVDAPFTETAAAAARPGRLLGRTSYMSDGVATTDLDTVVGYAGDWTQVIWGQVGGINFRISDEASVTINGSLVSTFENNLVALRAEVEYGCLVNDADAFCRITNLTGS